jgi:hypothetical protein
MKVERPAASLASNKFTYNWYLLKPWVGTIAVATVVTATITFVVTKLCLTHYYQATAVIRPVSQSDQGNLASGMLAGMSSAIGSLTGLSGDEEKDAEKYISIVNSYSFAMEILKRANLSARLIARSWGHRLFGWPVSKYRLYEKMDALFDADYSIKMGNVTMTFLDPDPIVAQKVLGDYLKLLRERLRQHEIESSTAAISSLEKEAAATSDAQLQGMLYDSIAKQIQRRGMAQVQANFSFDVIDPPIASDRIYAPKVMLDSALAALLTPLLAVLILLANDRISSGGRVDLSDLPSAPIPIKEDEPASPPRRAMR